MKDRIMENVRKSCAFGDILKKAEAKEYDENKLPFVLLFLEASFVAAAMHEVGRMGEDAISTGAVMEGLHQFDLFLDEGAVESSKKEVVLAYCEHVKEVSPILADMIKGTAIQNSAAILSGMAEGERAKADRETMMKNFLEFVQGK